MDAQKNAYIFETTAQRVASSYCRMLAEFHPVLPESLDAGSQADMAASQAELHAFFQALYGALFASPERFGLPTDADISVHTDRREGASIEAVNKALKRPCALIEAGLDFLALAAQQGRLEGAALVLDAGDSALAFTQKKSGRAWMDGLQSVGLSLEEAPGGSLLASTAFPKMMLALQALALACASCADAHKGMAFFSRCDFRALKGDFSLDAHDLFRVFTPDDSLLAAQMHDLLIGRGYKPEYGIRRNNAWIVKYQGKKAIKGTPLFQIWFDERFNPEIQVQIKCASSTRLVPALPSYSQALQADFARHAIDCGSCHWCDHQKTLGPVEYEYQGQKRTICWWVPGDVQEFTGETLALVNEYAELHERLAA